MVSAFLRGKLRSRKFGLSFLVLLDLNELFLLICRDSVGLHLLVEVEVRETLEDLL